MRKGRLYFEDLLLEWMIQWLFGFGIPERTNIPIDHEVKLIVEIGRDVGGPTAPRVPSTLAATGTSIDV